jgi:hypothetical protein
MIERLALNSDLLFVKDCGLIRREA